MCYSESRSVLCSHFPQYPLVSPGIPRSPPGGTPRRPPGDPQETPRAQRKTASYCLLWAPRGKTCVLLQSGVQHFLNKCFAADKAVSAYCLCLQFLTAAKAKDAGSDPNLMTLRLECLHRNYEIISGNAGLEILEEHSKFFRYNADVWDGSRAGDNEKFKHCLDTVVVLQEVSYRLVFKCNQPKFDIFEVCLVPDGEASDEEKVKSIARRLRAKRNACDGCVDIAFTDIWAYRLVEMGSVACREAHRALLDILAVMRVTSSKCERKHLEGQ